MEQCFRAFQGILNSPLDLPLIPLAQAAVRGGT
jgi:hypothetical protein